MLDFIITIVVFYAIYKAIVKKGKENQNSTGKFQRDINLEMLNNPNYRVSTTKKTTSTTNLKENYIENYHENYNKKVDCVHTGTSDYKIDPRVQQLGKNYNLSTQTQKKINEVYTKTKYLYQDDPIKHNFVNLDTFESEDNDEPIKYL